MSDGLEARLSISAVDKTGTAFAAVEESVTKVEKSVGGIAKALASVDKVAASVGPVSARLDRVAASVTSVTAATRGLAAEQSKLQLASERLAGFQGMTAQLEKLDAASTRWRTRLAEVSGAIEATDKPTKKLQNSLMIARANLDRANAAFGEQQGKVAAARASLEEIIGPVDNVVSAQARLAGEIERVNGAMAAQGRVAARASEQLAAAVRQEEATQKRRAAVLKQLNDQLLPFAGPLILEGEKRSVEAAAEVEQLRFRVRELSRGDATEAPFADKLADEVAAKYPAITRGKALDTYLELRANAASADPNAPIDQAKARSNLMIAARAQTAALALGFEMTPVDMQNLLKSVEGSGRAADPQAVEKISDAYIRAKQVFGTAIASQMVRDYVQNAKSANFSIGEDQFYLSNMVKMSEGNASRLGNEVSQAMATLVGGKMTKQAAERMVSLGLIGQNQVHSGGGGRFYISGNVKDAATLATDQQAWATTTLREAIEKSGAISDAKVNARVAALRQDALKHDPNAQIDERFLRGRAEEGLISAELAKIGFRLSVSDLLAHAIGNERLIERDVGQLKRASGLEAGDRIAENPVAAFQELTQAIANFSAVLSGPAISGVGPLLDQVARGIAGLSAAIVDFEKANPELAKILSTGALGGAGLFGLYQSWKLLSGFGSAIMGGGSNVALTGSAKALGGSAFLLDDAAAALGVAADKLGLAGGARPPGVVPGEPTGEPRPPGGPPRPPGLNLSWEKWATLGLGYIGLAAEVANSPPVGSKEWADQVNANDAFWDRAMASVLPKGWVTPLPPLEPAGASPTPDTSALQAALARQALDPEVAALVDRDYRERARNAPEDSPEARRGRAMHEAREDMTVSLDPNSKADIEVRVTVEPSGDLIRAAASASASSSGSVKANVGVSSAGVAPNGQGGIGSR